VKSTIVLPPIVVITSVAPESAVSKVVDGRATCAAHDSTMKSRPPPTVTDKMARGISRRGSLASSAMVETASKPRKLG